MDWIDLFMMILVTDVSGTGSYLLWKLFGSFMERKGRVWGVRLCLSVVFVFFLVPAMFFYTAYRTFFSGE